MMRNSDGWLRTSTSPPCIRYPPRTEAITIAAPTSMSMFGSTPAGTHGSYGLHRHPGPVLERLGAERGNDTFGWQGSGIRLGKTAWESASRAQDFRHPAD